MAKFLTCSPDALLSLLATFNTTQQQALCSILASFGCSGGGGGGTTVINNYVSIPSGTAAPSGPPATGAPNLYVQLPGSLWFWNGSTWALAGDGLGSGGTVNYFLGASFGTAAPGAAPAATDPQLYVQQPTGSPYTYVYAWDGANWDQISKTEPEPAQVDLSHALESTAVGDTNILDIRDNAQRTAGFWVYANLAGTDATTVEVRKNGVVVGTFSMAAGLTTSAVAALAISLVVGDRLTFTTTAGTTAMGVGIGIVWG